MGNTQSKVPAHVAARDKALLERLRSMQLEKKDTSDDDYVHVQHFEKDSDPATEGMTDLKTRLPKGLSISDAQKWQASLLRDPKNRYSFIPSCIPSCIPSVLI